MRRTMTILASLVWTAIGMFVLSSCNPVPTRHLVVTTATDGSDAAPGDGLCEVTQGQGDCSLRAAVDEANVTSARVDIAVPAGTYRITSVGFDDLNRTGDLDLHSPSPSVGIHSSGSGALIDANGAEGGLDVGSGTVGTALISVTGALPDASIGTGFGVRAGGTSSVTLLGGTVSHNPIGIVVDPGASVRTSYMQITDNVWYGILNRSTAVIEQTIVSNHTLAGIWFEPGGAPLAGTVRESIVRGNGGPQALPGGGIVSGSGFGDPVVADLTVERTTIDHNRGQLGGGIVFQKGHLSVSDSTIAENSSEIAAAGLLLGSTAPSSGPGESRYVIARSTIVDNHWDRGPSAAQIDSAGPVEVSGSIIGGADDDCATALVSGGHNLGTDASCGLTQSTDRVVADLLLGPLGPNGGLTPTRMPDADSPAVDAIPLGVAGICDATTPADQRGVARPVGPACDIGAVERDHP